MTAPLNAPAARSSFWPSFAALVIGACAMGVSPTFVRLADVGPFASAFYRVFLALPVLYAWMRIEDSRSADGKGDSPMFTTPIIITGVLFAADLFFWHLAVMNTTVANAAFFATTAPIWVILFGWLIFGRRPNVASVGGLALCMLGGAALVGDSFAVDPGRLVGDALAAITAIFFGAYFLAVERSRERTGAARATFAMSLICSAILLVVALGASFFLGQRFLPASWEGWAILIALGVISHAGGQGLLAVALGSLPAMFSSLVIFLETLAAALAGWLVLSEAVTWLQALGGLIILGGIYVARPKSA
jgi:drug/metabolite transporter (DMT)-like permease